MSAKYHEPTGLLWPSVRSVFYQLSLSLPTKRPMFISPFRVWLNAARRQNSRDSGTENSIADKTEIQQWSASWLGPGSPAVRMPGVRITDPRAWP